MGANETPHEHKLRWSNPYFERGGTRDGVSTAVGRKGTYEWVIKDGLHAAYFYPGGVQTSTPVVLAPPGSSGAKAYRACVEHNKAGL